MNRKLETAVVVARWLDVPVDRVYQLAREGILPHVRLGRQLRFDAATVERFIDEGGRAFPGGWKKQA